MCLVYRYVLRIHKCFEIICHKYNSCLLINWLQPLSNLLICVFSCCLLLNSSHAHTYTRTHTPTNMDTHTHTRTHAHTHTHTHTHSYGHTHAHTYNHTQKHIHALMLPYSIYSHAFNLMFS